MIKDNAYFKNRIMKLNLDRTLYNTSFQDEALFRLYQDFIQLKNINADFDIKKVKSDFIEYIKKLDPKNRLFLINDEINSYIWGMKPKEATTRKILSAAYERKNVYFAEDAFLRCIVGNSHDLPDEQKHYQCAFGYIFDDLTTYFDATRPSRIELILNSDFKVTEAQKNQARKIIDKILKNKISKYNNQPIYTPSIGKNSKKVLVIDQSYRDFSISKGLADDNTFKIMLKTAIKENPDADILIKTHPDAIGKKSVKPVCYYQGVDEKNNVYKITEGINPFSIINYVDKVYVCSSQFGFEALMAGKEVHTFGMPFYAGWGLTVDNLKCERRTRKRSLEEIFYIAYIYMAQYFNPMTNKECEIEEAIDCLIQLRSQYFKENNIKCEIGV